MKKEAADHHDAPHHRETVHRLARIALFGFIVTFIIARAIVFLIMAHSVPNMYFFMNGTHVHHLNYGIFTLSVVAGYSVIRRPTGGKAELTALLYGFAMALTFDEFGMWLNLGGSYWQRASIDAVIVIAALLGLLSFARSIRKFQARHFWGFLALGVALIFFAVVLYAAGAKLGDVMGPTLHQLEASSSP